MGWMFDTMAQQLFNLARKPAIKELLGAGASNATVDQQAAWATSIFMIGWAIGGVFFGVLGDRIGRVKTMTITILSYTVFTGLSVLSTSVWNFNVFRFLCGLGVGGQFAVGVALVAEVVPSRARPYALGFVQAASAIGNMIAAMTGILVGQMEAAGTITGAWRWEFLAGAVPAPLAFIVFKKLKEPESWLKARSEKKKLGSYGELFSDPRWRRNSIVGFLLAFAGVVGLWGIGFFSYDLFRPVLERTFAAEGLAGKALAGKVTTWIGMTSLLQNIGCFFGIYAFTYLTHYTGRKKAFAIAFLAAMGMTVLHLLEPAADQRYLLDDSADGIRAAFALRRLFHLPGGIVPHAAAQHRHKFLLQRGAVRRGGRPVHAGLSDQGRLRRLRRADALCRRDDEPGLPGRTRGAAVRPGNQRQAAPRVEGAALAVTVLRRAACWNPTH